MLAQQRDLLEVLRARVAPAHRAQHAVRARLDRQVQVGAHALEVAQRARHPLVDVARVRGREAQPPSAPAPRRRAPAGSAKSTPRRAVGVDRLPEQHHLAVAFRDDGLAPRPRSSATGRFTSGPRVRGTTQKLQTRLQPSIAVTYARTGFSWAVTASGTSNASARRSRSIATFPVSAARSSSSGMLRRLWVPTRTSICGRILGERLALELRDAAPDADPQLGPALLRVPEAHERLLELDRRLLAHGAGVEEDEVGARPPSRRARSRATREAPRPSRSR